MGPSRNTPKSKKNARKSGVQLSKKASFLPSSSDTINNDESKISCEKMKLAKNSKSSNLSQFENKTNASHTLVRKPRCVTKLQNSIPAVNAVSSAKEESDKNDNSLCLPKAKLTKNRNKNTLEIFDDDAEISDDNTEISDSISSLSEKKCFNYVRKHWNRPKRTNLAKSIPTEVANCFKNLKYSSTKNHNFLAWIKALTDAFKDASISPEIGSITFYVLKYFSLIEKYNPVRDFMKQQDPSVFLSPFEERVVSVLFDLESSDVRFQDLILSIVINIRLLVLAEKNLSLPGSCALCRIYALMCKSKTNKEEAISFCYNILKIKHKYGPMLIATIVGIWNDLFDIPYDVPEEEAVFYSSLYSNALQAVNGLKLSDWEISKSILEKYLSVSPIKPSPGTVDFLIESIKEKCIKETYAKEYLLTTPLVLFAAYSGWHWAKTNIIDKYLVPYICNCIDPSDNLRALTLFCKLYAEICLFCPNKENPEKILYELFEEGKEIKESALKQEAAAPALIQLLLTRNKPLSKDLQNWYKENKNNQEFLFLEIYFHRNTLSNKTDFTELDII